MACKAASVAGSLVGRRIGVGVIDGVVVDDDVADIGELGAVIGGDAVDEDEDGELGS